MLRHPSELEEIRNGGKGEMGGFERKKAERGNLEVQFKTCELMSRVAGSVLRGYLRDQRVPGEVQDL